MVLKFLSPLFDALQFIHSINLL